MRDICDRVGAALIIDDVRVGLRVDLRGSWEAIGVRPDLSAWSKSLANGYPLAALMGAEPYRDVAGRITATGSFWYAAAPMAAALTTIRILKETDGIELMRAAGERFQEGLRAQAAAHGFDVSVTGPPPLPLLLFADDPEFARGAARGPTRARATASTCTPSTTGSSSTAHDEATIDEALTRTDQAFADLRARTRSRLRR